MRIVVARDSWQVITRELDRVAPDEGVLLPVVALEHRADPCAPIALADLTTVVLAAVRCVPPELQRGSLMRVVALPRSDAWADGVVGELVRRHPRVRAAAYLHSHPFADDRTWPSGADIDGHMRPLLARNAEAGLCASFSFIACRRGRGWALPCFAMDARGRVSELGDSEVVDDDCPAIVHARAGRTSRPVLKRWRAELRRRGFAPRLDELFGGWSRVRIPLDGHRVVVALFPVDFPATPPQYHLVDTRTRRAERLDLAFALDGGEIRALSRAEAA